MAAFKQNEFEGTVVGGFVTIQIDPPTPNSRVGLVGYAAGSDQSNAPVTVDNIFDPTGAATATQIYPTLQVPATSQVLQNRLPETVWTTKGDTLRVRIPATAAGSGVGMTIWYQFAAG